MAWIASHTSSGGPPEGSEPVMKSPMMSPSEDFTSSPTMASSGSLRLSSSAPSAVWWSVRAIRSSPSWRLRATSVPRPVKLSGEKREWRGRGGGCRPEAGQKPGAGGWLSEEGDDRRRLPGADGLVHQQLLGPVHELQHRLGAPPPAPLPRAPSDGRA